MVLVVLKKLLGSGGEGWRARVTSNPLMSGGGGPDGTIRIKNEGHQQKEGRKGG